MSKRYTCTLCNGTGGFSHTVRHAYGCRGDYYPATYVTRTPARVHTGFEAGAL